jgi:hypothetical protein
MKLCLIAAAAITSAALAACAPTRYAYAPVTTTSADLAGASAAVYGLPPSAPRGEVRVAMMGVSPLSEAGQTGSAGADTDAIHVALAVSNRSDEAWTVDPSEQRLTLTMDRRRSDIYATSGGPSPSSTVLVTPRSTRMINLYFPLPIQFKKEDAPPPFDVFWTVHVGGKPITQRTSFQRFIVSPTPDEERDLRKPDELSAPSDRVLPGTDSPEHRPVLPIRPLEPMDVTP